MLAHLNSSEHIGNKKVWHRDLCNMNINANTKSSHVIPTNHRKANNTVRKNM